MSRPLIYVSLLLAIVGAAFGLAHVADQLVPVFFAAAIILTNVGILTGQ